MEKNEARRRAEEFGRTLTDHWEEWAFEIGLWATPAVTGIYGFAWYPTAKDEEWRQILVRGKLAHPRRPGHRGRPARARAEGDGCAQRLISRPHRALA